MALCVFVFLMRTIITKFGGSVFQNESSYQGVACHINDLAQDYDRVICVVSAQKGVSDNLIDKVAGSDRDRLQMALKGEIDCCDYDNPGVARDLIQGEFDSVDRLVGVGGFSGLKQVQGSFPVIANSSYLNAQVYMDYSWQFAQDNPIDSGVTIVAGYGARDLVGKVVLLGRNASDYVAALLANLYEADALRFYKDVDGVYENFGFDGQLKKDVVSRKYLRELGDTKVLDSRVLGVDYQGDIEIMRFGDRDVGQVIRG
jgi:aspartokinase